MQREIMLPNILPGNEIMYDQFGRPSIMVRIPKLSLRELGLDNSDCPHPAFIVNGKTVDSIYISKYLNTIIEGNATSLPGKDPASDLSFDDAVELCRRKGRGWHLMTRMEWGLLLRWCECNGFIPSGNVNYGKSEQDTIRKAIPTTYGADGRVNHTATGSGPVSWFHDGTYAGIADLCGNLWEWSGGIRAVHGELQLFHDNNAADMEHLQSPDSNCWRAIDAASGRLVIPNGNGTTEGTIKMDHVNGRLIYGKQITNSDRGKMGVAFGDILCTNDIGDNSRVLLAAVGMLPAAISGRNDLCETHYCYSLNHLSEELFYSGGRYTFTKSQMASFHGRNRHDKSPSVGFRTAFIDLG